MALDLEKLRAAVNERKVERPAFTEVDLETEKDKLRDQIYELKGLNTEGVSDHMNLNDLRLQELKSRLEELEASGLAAMLSDKQQQDEVVAAMDALHREGRIGGLRTDSEEEEET